MPAENQTSHCHEFSDNGEYEVACYCGLHIDATPPRELVEEARQMAFEAGGLEGGEYHLADDELEQIIQHVISQTIVDREVKFHDAQAKWMPVSERLPPEDQEVLCWCDDGTRAACEVASHHNSFFTDWGDNILPVTHWMPLPAAPEVPA